MDQREHNESHWAVVNPRRRPGFTFVGEDKERERETEHDAAQELLKDDIEMCRVRKEKHDEVWNQYSVLRVLSPKGREARMANEFDVVPLVKPEHVDSVVVDEQQVESYRKSEADDRKDAERTPHGVRSEGSAVGRQRTVRLDSRLTGQLPIRH